MSEKKHLYIILVFQLIGFWPVWAWYVRRMTDGSDEPWGIVALLTAVVYVFMGRKETVQRETGGLFLKSKPFWVLTPLSLLLSFAKRKKGGYLSLSTGVVLPLILPVLAASYLLCFSSAPMLLKALAAVVSVSVVLGLIKSGRPVHLGVMGLMVLSLPIIASLQFFLGYPVRVLTAHASAGLLSAAGFGVEAAGSSLWWMGETVSVDAPCSGVKMLWSALYLCFTLACFSGLWFWRTWACYVLSSVAVFLGNVLRTTVLFFPESGLIPSAGWMHQAVGIAAFGLVALVVIKLNRLLVFGMGRKEALA